MRNFYVMMTLLPYGNNYAIIIIHIWKKKNSIFFFSYNIIWILYTFSAIQTHSHVQLFETSWTAAHLASLSITNAWSLLKLMRIHSVIPSNHLILCHPLLLLPSISPNINVFSNESVLCISWPEYWSFSFSISPSSKYSGLISLGLIGLISLLSKVRWVLISVSD